MAEIKKGLKFYIVNGMWSGTVIQDDKDGKYYITLDGEVSSGIDSKVPENVKYIEYMFSDVGEINVGYLSEDNYFKLMERKGILNKLNEGDLVMYDNGFYIVDKGCQIISADKGYVNNYPIKLYWGNKKVEARYGDIYIKDSKEFVETVRGYLDSDSMKSFALLMLELNEELKDKVNNLKSEE